MLRLYTVLKDYVWQCSQITLDSAQGTIDAGDETLCKIGELFAVLSLMYLCNKGDLFTVLSLLSITVQSQYFW